jgi:MOSC domain-containing protein YiiM
MVISIYVRPERLLPVSLRAEGEAIESKGLETDRSKDGNRQVTFIRQEHILALASYLRMLMLDFKLTGRNIFISGINLHALKSKQFAIGDAIFEYSG